MCHAAKDGRHLANLVVDAAALCKAAQDRMPWRVGPGRPESFEQWQIAVLIMIAVLAKRKSKSSQHRYLAQHQDLLEGELGRVLGLSRLPSRATYMRRYREAYPLFERAIELGARAALIHHVADAKVVAVDKSMIAARGRKGPSSVRSGIAPGVDREAGWGRSAHDGWVWGFSYEVVVCVGNTGLILPILASADKASVSEHRSFGPKIKRLPKSTRYVLGDGGYDDNRYCDAIEYDRRGRRTHRRLLAPLLARGGKPAVGREKRKGERERFRQQRILRERCLRSRLGRRLYKRRSRSVEPFNSWFKQCFELEQQVWHRGLDNNRTMLLSAIFIYQCLQRYSFKLGRRDGSIQWLLDAL
jgi:hypothetical protein